MSGSNGLVSADDFYERKEGLALVVTYSTSIVLANKSP